MQTITNYSRKVSISLYTHTRIYKSTYTHVDAKKYRCAIKERNMSLHTHIIIYIYTYILKHIHSYAYADLNNSLSNKYKYTCANPPIYILRNRHVYIHTQIHICLHTNIHSLQLDPWTAMKK